MKSNSFSHSVEDKKSNKSKVAERRMNEIYKGICQHRQFLEDLLRHNSLPTDLKSHLYLLLTAPTKSSSSTILTSLKSHYSDDIMKALMNAIDSKAIKLNSSCADDALCERLDEIKKMKSKVLNHDTMETAACPSVASASVRKDEKRVKKNTASILRAGAVISKAIKANDSMVNDLMSGGNNPFLLKLHVQKRLQETHEKEMEEIERRHLIGLISWEEAKMAKLEALKAKRKIASELKWEKSQLRNVIKTEIEQKVTKSKHIVRKIHLGRLMTRRKRFDLNSARKINAENLKKINQKLMSELEEARAMESLRKVEIVREEKSRKEICKNLKRCCHRVDINKLKESITNLRHQINLEKSTENERRKRIHDERERQKQLIANTKTLISVGRKYYHETTNPKQQQQTAIMSLSSPDLMRLREKLVLVRCRLASEKCSS